MCTRIGRQVRNRWGGLAALLVVGLVSVVAAKSPVGLVPAKAVVLVLDNSGSNVLPRQDDLVQFARTVGPGGQVAVIIFDSTARLELPLSTISDSASTAMFTKAIATADGRGLNTVLNAGLEAAAKLLSGTDSVRTERRVILFTDGISDPPKRLSRDSLTRDWQRLISVCATAGIKVSAVLPPGSKVDLRSMEALCSATRGLCVVSSEPAKLISAVLGVATDEHGIRFGSDGTSAASKKAGPWRTMFLLSTSLLLCAAGVGTAVLMRRRASRRRLPSPSERERREGLAGIAEAVAQLRTLAAGLGEPGVRIRELAASVEAAGCVAVNERRSAGQRTKTILGEVMAVRDEVEDILRALAEDVPGRENLKFVDELLEQVLTKAGVRVMTVPTGASWDPALHEPRPERSPEPRGKILRVARKGYVTLSSHGPPKVLRSARVVVSDGSGSKEV